MKREKAPLNALSARMFDVGGVQTRGGGRRGAGVQEHPLSGALRCLRDPEGTDIESLRRVGSVASLMKEADVRLLDAAPSAIGPIADVET